MKKLIIILLVLLLAVPCFARTYTEEEFFEVYNALKETTDLLKEAGTTIADLQGQVEKLTESNKTLIDQFNSAKEELNNAYKLLDKAEKELKSSSKVIETLNNQKIFLGGGVALRTDFHSVPNYGFKINAGYKVFLGYIIGDFTFYNDKSLNFGVSYNLIF